MSDHDDRLTRHLRGLAATIELRPGDPAAAVSRAARRRQRRRAGLGAALGLVAVTTTVVAVGSRPDDELQAGSPFTPLAATEFDWAVVDPDVSATVGNAAVTTDGTLYGLSTAPGRIDGDSPSDASRRVLYRSADGAEWTQTALPEDLWASDVTAAGDTVYAVGTGAAGGEAGALRLVSSGDGGATWEDLALPLDLAGLRARHPGEISVSGLDVAAGPAGVVAAVTVQAAPNIEARVPAGVELDLDNGWSWDTSGVTIYGAPEAASLPTGAPPAAAPPPPPPAAVAPSAVPPPLAEPASEASTTVPAEASPAPVEAVEERDQQPESRGAVGEPPVVATYTWAELGVEGELLELITPRVHLIAAPDGADFREVTVDVDAGRVSSTATVLATPDGFLALVQRFDEATDTESIRPFASVDGLAWEAAGPDLPGYLRSAGLLAGRPAVVTDEIPRDDGGGGRVITTLRVQDPAGSWSAVDALAPLLAGGADATELQVVGASIGPLGAVVVVHRFEGGGGELAAGASTLVVSTTGADLTVVPVADHVEAPFASITGIIVTADAISATVVETEPGLGVADQRVLVGTPRG